MDFKQMMLAHTNTWGKEHLSHYTIGVIEGIIKCDYADSQALSEIKKALSAFEEVCDDNKVREKCEDVPHNICQQQICPCQYCDISNECNSQSDCPLYGCKRHVAKEESHARNVFRG